MYFLLCKQLLRWLQRAVFAWQSGPVVRGSPSSWLLSACMYTAGIHASHVRSTRSFSLGWSILQTPWRLIYTGGTLTAVVTNDPADGFSKHPITSGSCDNDPDETCINPNFICFSHLKCGCHQHTHAGLLHHWATAALWNALCSTVLVLHLF